MSWYLYRFYNGHFLKRHYSTDCATDCNSVAMVFYFIFCEKTANDSVNTKKNVAYFKSGQN